MDFFLLQRLEEYIRTTFSEIASVHVDEYRTLQLIGQRFSDAIEAGELNSFEYRG